MSTQLVSFWWYFTWGKQICWLIDSTRKRNDSTFRKTWAAMITGVPLQRLGLPLLHSENCYSKAPWKEGNSHIPSASCTWGPQMYIVLGPLQILSLFSINSISRPLMNSSLPSSKVISPMLANVHSCSMLTNVHAHARFPPWGKGDEGKEGDHLPWTHSYKHVQYLFHTFWKCWFST